MLVSNYGGRVYSGIDVDISIVGLFLKSNKQKLGLKPDNILFY